MGHRVQCPGGPANGLRSRSRGALTRAPLAGSLDLQAGRGQAQAVTRSSLTPKCATAGRGSPGENAQQEGNVRQPSLSPCPEENTPRRRLRGRAFPALPGRRKVRRESSLLPWATGLSARSCLAGPASAKPTWVPAAVSFFTQCQALPSKEFPDILTTSPTN